MQPRRRKIGHDGSALPSVPLIPISSPVMLDVQDGLFAQMRERGGENTPARSDFDLYRGVNAETALQTGGLQSLSAQSARIAREHQPSSAEMAATPLPLEAILAIRHNATHKTPAKQADAEPAADVAAAPQFHSKLDRESFPVALFDILTTIVCASDRSVADWQTNLADLLAYENCMFLSEPADYTAQRRGYLIFERNSASRRNFSAHINEWRSRWIGPFGGGEPIKAQDFILFDEEDLQKEAARPLPQLPAELLNMYPDGQLVCDIYRIDESFYAMCFYRPCATTPGHHQYLGCFYTQSEQSTDRDLSSQSRETDHQQ